MKIAIYYKKYHLRSDARVLGLFAAMTSHGLEVEFLSPDNPQLPQDVDMVLAFGGDGTFLSAAALLAGSEVPLMGVNFGRIGFLSESDYEIIPRALAGGLWEIDRMPFLHATGFDGDGLCTQNPYALNEITLNRTGHGMMGIDVEIDGTSLPTYWADGIIVSTAAGSTAYSLSAGGPIVFPSSGVLVLCPIAPHNLNVRPLVIPETSHLRFSVRSKSGYVGLNIDNRSQRISSQSPIDVSLAQFSLSRARLQGPDFVQALRTKLFWGEDIRNM